MAAVVPCGTRNSEMACSETGSPSSVQLKMNGEDPEYLSLQRKISCLTHR
jgi:hypothetical protein